MPLYQQGDLSSPPAVAYCPYLGIIMVKHPGPAATTVPTMSSTRLTMTRVVLAKL
jgi:hypothetical protein